MSQQPSAHAPIVVSRRIWTIPNVISFIRLLGVPLFRLGELLDPFADRLYILATLIGFTLREVVPWWLTAALLLREVVLGVGLLVLRRHGYGPPAVHYVGKTGTFVLLAAFPIVLLSQALPGSEHWLGPVGWGLMWWALGLYWAAAVFYWIQTISLVRADRASGGGDGPGPAVPPAGPATPTGPAAVAQ
jgi:cardiolipin synthase (CMP-forming)